MYFWFTTQLQHYNKGGKAVTNPPKPSNKENKEPNQ